MRRLQDSAGKLEQGRCVVLQLRRAVLRTTGMVSLCRSPRRQWTHFTANLEPCCLFMRIDAPALGHRHVYSTWPSRTTAGTSNGRHEKRPGLRCSSGGGHFAHWPVAQTDGRRRAAPLALAGGNGQLAKLGPCRPCPNNSTSRVVAPDTPVGKVPVGTN